MLRRHFIATAPAALIVGACTGAAVAQDKQAAPGKAPSPTAGPRAAGGRTILVVGDSLSAEYGLRRGTGWVALLEKRVGKEFAGTRVVNASISGDTTSGGRSRLGGLLAQHRPSHVVIELGGNDALRGLPLAMTRDNLSAMVQAAQSGGAKVLVVGMQMPPNYGAAYGAEFAGLFATVAREYKAGLVPFLLKGVADDADPTRLFQADRIHPREEAHPQMLENVWPTLRRMLS